MNVNTVSDEMRIDEETTLASFSELSEECSRFIEIVDLLKGKGLTDIEKNSLLNKAMSSLQHISVDSKVNLEMITENESD